MDFASATRKGAAEQTVAVRARARTVSDMGKLQRSGYQKWAKTKRSAVLPSWAPAVGMICLVIVCAVLLWALLGGGSTQPLSVVPATTAVANSGTSGGETQGNGGGQVVVSTTILGPGVGGSGATVNVANANGGSCPVAQAAFDMAQSAAVGYFSGNFAGVSFAIPTPAPKIRYTNVQATNPTMTGCEGSGATNISFQVLGDDGLSTSIKVAVTNGNRSWQVIGLD